MLTLSRLRLFHLLAITALLLAACGTTVPATVAPPTAAYTLQPTSTHLPTATFTAKLPPSETHTPSPIQTDTPVPTPLPAARRVLIISLDGLRPESIAAAPMPNLQALMQISAYTLSAQTIFPSATLPAHTSMLTGLCPAKHGVDWNDYLPEKGFAKGPSLFEIAHSAGLQTVMFVGKEKLRQITEPANTDIFRYINDRDVVIAQRITEEFPVDFGVMFVHFPTPDAMGHVYGWMSPQYISVVQRADEAIGTLLKDLDDHGLRQETIVIITADHGGHNQTHGSRAPEDMTIPWVISGPGVRPGPLSTPVQTTDTAATAAWVLGLPLPQEWDGWPVFEAFNRPIQPRPVPFCN